VRAQAHPAVSPPQVRTQGFTCGADNAACGLSYREETGGKTGGSRWFFVHDTVPDIFAHKPYPGNIVRAYVVKNVLAALKEGELI